MKDEYCTIVERGSGVLFLAPMDIIDRWLNGDKENSKKQCHRARRVYHRLCHEYGFQGSERAERRYVHDARNRL